MKRLTKIATVMLSVCLLFGAFTVPVQAKTYSASKVTSKQIVKELKKSFKIKDIYDYEENDWKAEDDSDTDKNEYVEQPNTYIHKTNFYDERYSTYCTVEVYSDEIDAGTRIAELRAYDSLYNTFGQTDDSANMHNYRYKNIVIRLSNGMSQKEALKYYKKLKKIIK
jgi:hypothetical protein